mgnify:CR=1 FL=1
MSKKPPPPPQERVDHYNNWHKFRQEASKWAQVPRQSKGGQPIYAHQLNPTSRGQNYNTRLSYPQRNGEIRNISLRNPHGQNYYVLHPDGQPHLPGPSHHELPHIHAVNSKGETKIITFGNTGHVTSLPPQNGGKLIRGISKGVSKAASRAPLIAGIRMLQNEEMLFKTK